MSEHASRTAAKRPVRPSLVIDGEAFVVSRRPRSGTGTEASAGSDEAAASMSPDPDVVRQAETIAAAFGRRPAQRRRPAPDLVFQGARPAGEPAPAPSKRRGLSVFTSVADFRSRSRDRRVAGAAGALAILALPLLVLSAPLDEAVATPGSDPFVLDELVTSIAPRGTGAVLTVSGRIRNVSGTPAPVPPLRIALAESDGHLRSKSLVTGVSRLESGRDVRFHSAVAVGKDTHGKIEVNLLAMPGSFGKTLVE